MLGLYRRYHKIGINKWRWSIKHLSIGQGGIMDWIHWNYVLFVSHKIQQQTKRLKPIPSAYVLPNIWVSTPRPWMMFYRLSHILLVKLNDGYSSTLKNNSVMYFRLNLLYMFLLIFNHLFGWMEHSLQPIYHISHLSPVESHVGEIITLSLINEVENQSQKRSVMNLAEVAEW